MTEAHCERAANGDMLSHTCMTWSLPTKDPADEAASAGEPELSVAPHVLRRQVDVYQQVSSPGCVAGSHLPLLPCYMIQMQEGSQGPQVRLLTSYGADVYKRPNISLLFSGVHYDLLTTEQPRSKL